jgi:hypothetical protein
MNQRTRLRRFVLPALLAGAALLVSSAASAGDYHGPFHAGNNAQLVVSSSAPVPHAYKARGIVPTTWSQSRAEAARPAAAPARHASSAHNFVLPL